MQELQKILINKIIKKENGHLNDLQEGFNNGLICALEYIEEALEKEKEQIIAARDGREISSFTTGKDYYELTYNQNK